MQLGSGDCVGGYTILDRLGDGGTGTVFRARSVTSSHLVALKVFSERLGNAASMRFHREAAVLARLQHPSIVSLLDTGVLDDRRPYIVSELVTGEDLSTTLQRRGPLPFKEVVELVLGVAEALAYVHAQGVVHGDLKPSNVMRTEAGRLVLLDFGIAAPIGAESLTATNTVFGTPGYIAPETLSGRQRAPAGDIYSLGVVAYELLCGTLPFRGARLFQVLRAAMVEAPEPLATRRPDIPRELDALVLRMMQKEPERRPIARELAEALRALELPPERNPDTLRSIAALSSPEHLEVDLFSTLGTMETMEVVPLGKLPDEAVRLLEQPGVVGVLLTTAGGQVGAHYPISDDATIGRNPDCDIQLASLAVSRHHARFYITRGAVTFQDLKAKIATTVNGKRPAGPVQLEHGDELRIGNVTLLFLQPRPEQAAEARRRLAELDARWDGLINAAAEGGARFVQESRRFLDDFLREAIGLRVERDVPLHKGVVGFMVEAPMLWIRHTRFPILFLQDDRDPALIDRLAECLQAGQLLGYFVVLIAVPPPGRASSARALRDRINGSPYRYDFVVLNREQLAELVRANEARRFVEIILEQGTDPGSLSPYIVRGPVPENMFFGREREVKTLTQGIGARSFAVVAGRRMGKSSTLLRVQRALASDPRYEPIYMSCEDRPTWGEFLAILSSEGDDARGLAEAEDPALVRPRVAAMRARAGGRTIVLLLDEIDALLAHDAARGGRLFRALRAVAHEGLCRFIFSGSRTLYQKLHDPGSPFFNFCEELLLRPLDDKAVEAIVRKPMQQLGLDLPDPARLVAEIVRVTSSHPNLVQIVCQELVAASPDRRVSAAQVEPVAGQREFQRSFVETAWSDTTPLERIISLLSPGPSFSFAELSAEARRRGLPDEGRVAEALEMLELYSLVTRDGDLYRFGLSAYPAMVRRSHDVEALIASLARRAAE